MDGGAATILKRLASLALRSMRLPFCRPRAVRTARGGCAMRAATVC